MGAENSVLEGCQWGDEVLTSNLDWKLQHADTKDGHHVTVLEPKKSERKYNEMLQHLAQSLKTLRHPSILRFAGVGQSSEGFQLVTEHVIPLISVMDKLSAFEICAGLYDVMDAIIFLHDKVGICHNNIGLGALFVAQEGGWRLGELQHACPFALATAEYLDACRAFRDQGALAPEEKQGNVEVKSGSGHVRDVYALGVLIEQLMDGLNELGEFTKMFEQRVSSCLSVDPSLRPTVLTLRNDSLFQNDFVQILSFLRNVALKTPEEKKEFFSGLLPRLLVLPEDLVGRRLAVPLLSRFVLLDDTAVSLVIPHLLTPKPGAQSGDAAMAGLMPVLNEAVFRTYVTPELQRILLVHDALIRLILLQHFSQYVHLFNSDALRDEIFPQILLGLRDTSDTIVAASLRALADLVPLLGGDTVIGGQRKTFFFHGLPKFSLSGQVSGKEKGKSPTNLMDAMHPLKSMANGKRLLKSLTSVSQKPKGDPEKEKKIEERERRREEAKLRKEERQRRLQQQLEKDRQTGSSDSTPLDQGSEDFTESKMPSIRGSHDEKVAFCDEDKVSRPCYAGENGSGGDKKMTACNMEDEMGEAGNDEWSDWDDTEADAAIKSRDDIISEEIEAELAQMTEGKSPLGFGSKVQTSPDPYRVGSPKTPDWNSENNIIMDSSHSYDKGAQDENPPLASKQPVGKGLKLSAKNRSTTGTAIKNIQAPKSSYADDLGLGYDIKSIELTAVKQEVDFFTDMMPDIKPKDSSSALGLDLASPGKDTEVSKSGSSAKQVSSCFAVAAEQAGDDAGGWGEDTDWGTDDF